MKTTIDIGDDVMIGIFEQDADDAMVFTWYRASVRNILYEGILAEQTLYQCEFIRGSGMIESRCVGREIFLRTIMTEDDIDHMVMV